MKADLSILPLRLEAVSYASDGTALLQDVAFTLEAGPRTLVLGPNGAGKSLLLRLCHGLITPTSGSVTWLGPALQRAGTHQAMVFQRPVMLRRSAHGNLVHALRLAGLDASAARLRADAALDRFGLGGLAKRPARVLSGGEQQRLALARAWAVRPQMLFLDEPTASLDPAATHAVEAIVAAFHAEGVKIMMSTHDLAQARRLADEILFLYAGRLIERAPADEFFNQPRTREAQAFLRGELLW